MTTSQEIMENIKRQREERIAELQKKIFVYKTKSEELKSKASLALTYLEDGAINSAKRILKEIENA